MKSTNPNNNTINNWVKIAEYDLETAKAMLKSGRYVYVAFTCQQAIEKILKALFVKRKGKTPSYTHNLTKLAEESEILIELTDQYRRILETLNLYYIQSRYADDIDKMSLALSKTETLSMLRDTENVYRWLKSLL